MAKPKQELKTLLLQIRDSARVRREEHESFARYSGLEMDQIEIFNVFDQPKFDVDIVEGYDALFVGGASEASVLEPDNYPFVPYAEKLLLHCIDINLPVFASCFGYQLATTALGGLITRDETDFEMGCIPISITVEGEKDPLFHDTPNNFIAIAVHQEKATDVPKNCISLAYTSECNHAYRVKDKPFWTFQFHPEVDKKTLVERLTIYKDKYTDGDGHLEEVLQSAVETPQSNGLLKKFVDRVLL